MMKSKIAMLLVAALMALHYPTMYVSASHSGMYYIGSTGNSYTGSEYVSINPNNTIIASSYGNIVMLHDSENLSLIETFDVQRNVLDLQFSPDGDTLAISIIGIEEVSDSVKFYDVNNRELLGFMSTNNNKRSNIDWSPDGNLIATTNFQNGVNIYNFNTQEIEVKLSNQHLEDITCIKFSNDGELLITGDEVGLLKLWNSDGTYTGKSLQLESEISGCGFNFQNQRISASSITGNLSSWTLSGNLLHQMNYESIKTIEWSKSLDQLLVLESGNEPNFMILDGPTFEVISKTYFIHKAVDFDAYELSDGVIDQIYASTDSVHIANYASIKSPYGFGQSGADLDGDQIPDRLDNDDDGDSILDEWDFNCIGNIIECQRSPDIDNIRSINFKLVENNLIIEDTYTFGVFESAEIRNLTRRSVIADQQISYEEANLFEKAICKNMESEDIINNWNEVIELSTGQVSNGTIDCQVTEGLVFSKAFSDQGIKLSFRVSFDIIPNMTLPLNVTISDQLTFSANSITHMVENHPILITSEIRGVTSEGFIWWNNEDSANVMFEQEISEENKIRNYYEELMDNKFLLSTSLVTFLVFCLIIYRIRNRISIDIDDDEDDAYQVEEEYDYSLNQDEVVDDYEEDVNIISKPAPIKSEKVLVHEEVTIHDDTMKIEDSPLARRTFVLGDDDQELIPEVKRRTGKMDRNRQGPIMSTKRKRLGGTSDTKNIKPSIRTVKKNVKKRKVKRTKTDFEDSDIDWGLD